MKALRWFATACAFLLAPLAWSQALPPCYAAPFGSGTYAQHGTVPDGARWDVWHCPTAFGWQSVVIASAPGYRMVVPNLEGLTIPQTMDAVWRANVTLSCDTPGTAIAAACAAGRAAAAGSRPADPLYRVASNSGRADRPVYVRDGDQVGALAEGRRAVVGRECQCRASGILRSGVAYCRWDGAQFGDELTVCTRQP